MDLDSRMVLGFIWSLLSLFLSFFPFTSSFLFILVCCRWISFSWGETCVPRLVTHQFNDRAWRGELIHPGTCGSVPGKDGDSSGQSPWTMGTITGEPWVTSLCDQVRGLYYWSLTRAEPHELWEDSFWYQRKESWNASWRDKYMWMHTYAHSNLNNEQKNIESLVFYSLIFHLVHTFLCRPSSFLLKS